MGSKLGLHGACKHPKKKTGKRTPHVRQAYNAAILLIVLHVNCQHWGRLIRSYHSDRKYKDRLYINMNTKRSLYIRPAWDVYTFRDYTYTRYLVCVLYKGRKNTLGATYRYETCVHESNKIAYLVPVIRKAYVRTIQPRKNRDNFLKNEQMFFAGSSYVPYMGQKIDRFHSAPKHKLQFRYKYEYPNVIYTITGDHSK